ncbi:MAG: diacylglycerol kinase family protein [Candidatus Omnitrophica bacterium]|nr:diacylglycerol kinase family protein [Candidatus Omnitrophota bacterium]
MQPPHSLFVSVRCAWQGIRYALATQRNMRLHLAVGIAVLALSAWAPMDAAARAVLWLTVAVVLAAELLNTALEVLVDVVSQEHRQDARLIKDLAAGAVLVGCVMAAFIGCALLVPPVLARLLAWLH